MDPSITETPQSASDIKKLRVMKERVRRSKETVAFHELRRTLEITDPKAFWRMEKVDIAEGAAYLIQKLAGGSNVITPEQEPIVFEEKNANREEKLDRIQVEKHRRKRESDAIKKLKQTLLIYSKDAHKKMERSEVLVAASEFLTTLKTPRPLKRPCPSNSISLIRSGISATPSSSADSISSPSTSIDSGRWSMTPPGFSPELTLLASLLLTPPYASISPFSSFNTPLPSSTQQIYSPPAKKSRNELWRPWE